MRCVVASPLPLRTSMRHDERAHALPAYDAGL
jgi:hypothetical protein